jgi:hypothetical protein
MVGKFWATIILVAGGEVRGVLEIFENKPLPIPACLDLTRKRPDELSVLPYRVSNYQKANTIYLVSLITRTLQIISTRSRSPVSVRSDQISLG